MHFRYDFGEKLDTAHFIKQAKFYALEKSNTWHFYFDFFRLEVEISNRVKNNFHVVIKFFDLEKDNNGEIINVKIINVNYDSRFDGFPDIQKFFNKQYPGQAEGSIWVVGPDEAIQSVVNILVILSKILKLKAFL